MTAHYRLQCQTIRLHRRIFVRLTFMLAKLITLTSKLTRSIVNFINCKTDSGLQCLSSPDIIPLNRLLCPILGQRQLSLEAYYSLHEQADVDQLNHEVTP